MMESLSVQDFWYDLPSDKIAMHPLQDRDQSKLLVYKKGTIEHSHFKSIAQYIPPHAQLYFNDTKVIPARLHFKKETGAEIEIFLLSPQYPSPLLVQAMACNTTTTWYCIIGNLKRWSSETVLTRTVNQITLRATLVDREKAIVKFEWTPKDKSFAQVIAESGVTPLPPYIKRSADKEDITRYQTIYSHYAGAVAAPTAGLHFTENIFSELEKKRIQKDFLTLHVSAGTFQPIKEENALMHPMHNEQVVVTHINIYNLLQDNSFVIPVGTTSMRTLESLYWYGVKLLKDSNAEFIITQRDPYKKQGRLLPSVPEALHAVQEYMDRKKIKSVTGHTSIYIYPGYEFKICKALVTNFHMPGSTLMLLVAAFVGDDWKKIYAEALQNDYRFLSYGDSSILIP